MLRIFVTQLQGLEIKQQQKFSNGGGEWGWGGGREDTLVSPPPSTDKTRLPNL